MDYTIHHLSITGDRQVGMAHAPEAQEVLRSLKNSMALSGISVGARFRRLSDTAYCHVKVAGGVNSITIVAGSSQERIDIPRFRYVKPPELLSGVVTYGFLSEAKDLLSSYYPTSVSQRLHKLPAGQQQSARLAVEPYRSINTSKLERPSQYSGVRPTMYSGRMKRVVQAVMALGRPPEEPLHEFRRKVRIGEKPEPMTPFELEVDSDGYQVRYDFGWFRTHGIGRGADGKLWLVEIGGTRGMIAMPLPLHPLSLDERYRKKAEEAGDSDVLFCLDEFGGIPTGESFPDSGDELDALIRAGRVVRLLERDQLSAFYELTGFSSACGWAFNESGTEAHNTAYGWYESGLQFAAHYNINIRIGALREKNDGSARDRMRQALLSQRQAIGRARFDIALSKLDYMTEDEVSAQFVQLNRDGAARYMQALDQLVARPIASGSSTIGRVGQGNMANAQTASVFNLKLWEPNWIDERALLSHDFSANVEPWIRLDECDTTVFVFFAGDQLKTIKFFSSNKNTGTTEEESDYEDCMFIGTWTKTTTFGGRGVRRCWYSQDFDDRKEFSDSVSIEQITGTKLGPGGAAWNDYISPMERGSIGRSVFFRRKTYRKSIGSQGQVTAVVCLPAYMREACYYAIKETESGVQESESWSDLSLPDPWSGEYIYSIFNQSAIGPCGPQYLTRYVDKVEYKQSDCSDLADSGPWLGRCDLVAQPRVDNVLIGGGISPYYPNPSYPQRPDGWSTQRPYSGTLKVKLVYFAGVVDAPDETGDTFEWVREDRSWFLPSPEVAMPDGTVKGYQMHMWSTANALGSSEALVYQVEPDAPESTKNADDMPYIKNQGCFIGVNNGG